MYDTIIIGAGMSGLAAGIRLAYFNRRVCILERHTTIGGLNSFYRLGGRNYDVGLHAVTNYTPKGAKQGPLARLLRQLRISWDELELKPQLGSRIAFPGVDLRMTNDFAQLESDIAERFPQQIDNFRKLQAQIVDYDALDAAKMDQSARAMLNEYLTDPLLIEMLFCPLMYYGSAREHDMDWGQFCIMFRSIFYEGFARPFDGVRTLLKLLVKKFRGLGGELRLRSGVRKIHEADRKVTSVELDDGSRLEAAQVLSSAGHVETLRLCDVQPTPPSAGQLSFIESISTLDCQPRDLGIGETIVFFNDHDTFDWRRPDALADMRSGVICSPNNYAYEEPLAEGSVRITSLANFDRWQSLDDAAYRAQKQHWYEQMTASAVRFVRDFRTHTVATDMFTPTTIRRFTGHVNGAVYGAPRKLFDGQTHLKNLFLCGTDQGFVGIIGSIISGITMANRYCLSNE